MNKNDINKRLCRSIEKSKAERSFWVRGNMSRTFGTPPEEQSGREKSMS
jgi:hypothetical protein